MGMLLATNIDKKPLLPSVANAINNLFQNPADAFFTGRIMDLLYDGVPIDCTAEDDLTTKGMCTAFDGMQPIRKIDNQHFAFSLFAGVS